MTAKREENNQQKKALIIETAMLMIEKSGMNSFNMKSLAEVSCVPRPTLYRYYTSKEALFHEIAVYWGTSFTLNIKSVRKQRQLNKALNLTFNAILQEANERPELFKVVLSAIFQANINAANFENDFAMLFFLLLKKFINVDENTLKKEDINVLLRLLLANLQLLVVEKVTINQALTNLSYCADILLKQN
jgi:AcrR family transcriptional regulator